MTIPFGDKDLRQLFFAVGVACVNELGKADGVKGIIDRHVFFGDSDDINPKRLMSKRKNARARR